MTATKFFDTKDQYLAFRKAFASAQNDSRAKHSFNPPKAYTTDAKGNSVLIPVQGRQKVSGWLSATHYVLHNVVRGLPVTRGFSPKTNAANLNNGGNVNGNLCSAVAHLSSLVSYATQVLNPEPITRDSVVATWWAKTLSSIQIDAKIEEMQAAQKNSWQVRSVNAFLEPFGGAFTIEQLASLKVPNEKLITTSPAFAEEVAGNNLSWDELAEIAQKHNVLR